MQNEEVVPPPVLSTAYRLEEDLFKMLRFVEKTKFSNKEKTYEKKLIQETFTMLCKKVNVYNQVQQAFDLSKSEILQKIFDSQDIFLESEVWEKLLYRKCTG